MKSRVPSILAAMFALLLPAAVTVMAPATSAQPPAKFRDVVHDALVTGADKHVADQGTYFNVNLSADIDDAWEWYIGTGDTYLNVDYGVSALGLLAAYERTGDLLYLQRADAVGGHLIDRYTTGVFAASRPYSQDVLFLLRLGELTGNPLYTNEAVSYYGRVISEFTPAGNVERHFAAGRGSLSGWDLAPHIVDAWQIGQQWYAVEMLQYLIENRSEWEHEPCCGGYDATTLSYGALLWAMGNIPDEDFADFRDELIGLLLDSQEPDGSWDSGDYQNTAYVLLGLDAGPRHPQVQRAVYKAQNYLVSSQDGAGGWNYGSIQVGEVNSEALWALGATRVDNGNHHGFTDPNPDSGNDEHVVGPVDPGS